MIENNLRFLSILLLFLFARCGGSGPDLEQIKIDPGFDRILLEKYSNPNELDSALTHLSERHPDFFPLYGGPILGLFQESDSIPPLVVWSNYYFNPQVSALRDSVHALFGDYSQEESEIKKGLQAYTHYFPNKRLPKVFFFLGGFNYTVVSMEEKVGIAPDQYLGPASEYYSHLPDYLRRKKDRAYLPTDVLKGWLESEVMADSSAMPNTLLDHILQFGKVLAVAKRCFPKVADTILTGFSQQQLVFCMENEFLMWSSLVQDQKLYTKDPRVISKFMNEAPFSPGMPAESPGKAAVWLGWRIVESFLERNPTEFSNLFSMRWTPEAVLQKSGYNPKKP